MVKYLVQVYTGDVKKAGTDANVYIKIFGERGDTGKRPLLKSKTHLNKWEGGQVIIVKILKIRIPEKLQKNPKI